MTRSDGYQPVIDELSPDGLLEIAGERLRLTARGRLLSNEVFARFLRDKPTSDARRHRGSDNAKEQRIRVH